MTKDEYSEVDRYRATPSGAAELAAASLTSEVTRILRLARNGARRNQKEVADILGVSEGRVSQVLSSEGNLTVAALAKYLRSFGYSVSLQVTPIDEGVSPIKPIPRRVRKDTPPRSRGQESTNNSLIIYGNSPRFSSGPQGVLHMAAEAGRPHPKRFFTSVEINSSGANSSPKNSPAKFEAETACK